MTDHTLLRTRDLRLEGASVRIDVEEDDAGLRSWHGTVRTPPGGVALLGTEFAIVTPDMRHGQAFGVQFDLEQGDALGTLTFHGNGRLYGG